MHKKKKKQVNRVLAAALSVTFTISFVPVTAFAEQQTETAVSIAETLESSMTEEFSTESDTLMTITESVSETQVFEEEQDSFDIEIPENNYPANYQMHIDLAEDMKDICQIMLNGTKEEISVQENDTVQVKIEITDNENKHYQIRAVRIGNHAVFSDAVGKASYEDNLQITKDMADENGNINLTVELEEYYTVQFSYDTSSGEVIPDKEYTITDESNPNKIIGTVRLNQDEKTIVTATPAEHYRVAEIKIDGKSNEYSGNDCNAVVELTENQNHTIEVNFKLNCYQIEMKTSGNEIMRLYSLPEDYCYAEETSVIGDGRIIGKSSAVLEYGKGVVGYIKPDENSYISSVIINGETYQGKIIHDASNWYFFCVEDVTEDMQIDIVILQEQTARLVLPERDEAFSCYESDVTLKLETTASENYPAVRSVTYWFEGEEERFIISDNFTGEIVIPKEHNGKNMIVHAEITYTDGHKISAKSDPFSINSIMPEIGITMTENIQQEDYQTDNAKEGYYWTGRTAKVIIDDRADTFPDIDKLINCFTIQKNGVELLEDQKKDMINYQPDNYETVSEQYDRTVVYLHFEEDGVYDWSFTYTNRAGKSTSKTIENEEHIHHFVIDSIEPEGSITVSENSWHEKLGKEVEKFLHFGIFTKYNFQVTIESEDMNPVEIEYYISHDTEPMQWDTLQALDEWTEYADSFLIEESNRYVIYTRLTDTSGNRIYLSSDGHIIDHEACTVELIPDEPNENGIYNHDVGIDIAVEEKLKENGTYSGIKKVEYWVTANGETTQEEILYQFEYENPQYSDLMLKQNFQITVNAEKNNSDNVQVYVKVTDNAENEIIKKLSLRIDTISPEISVSYDNDNARNEKYFNAERTATISVTETNFNPQDVVIKVNDDIMTELVWHDNKTEIPFQDDGKYHLTIAYTDNAGNPADSVSEDFVIDTKNPTGSVTIKENIWYALLETLTFGIFSNDNLNVSIVSDDETSGVEKTEYCFLQIQQNETVFASMGENPEELKKSLEQLPQEVWKSYDKPFAIEKNVNESNIVYVRITDKAGNTCYLGSDGYILDDESCEIILTPDKTNARIIQDSEGKESVYYHDDVTVELKVRDNFPYSGIQSVKYWVTVNGEKTIDGEETIHDEYIATSEHLETDKNKAYDEWTKSVVIPYNSSDVVLHVETIDFAGNSSHKELLLDIDKTAPEIAVSYDNQNGIKDTDGRYYFKDTRTATITFTERGNHFSRNDALNNIFIMDIYHGSAEGTYEFGEWTTIEGTSENHDDDKHMITIRYFGDANYHFDISYTDKAGNQNSDLDAGNSVALHDFTVDTTAPYGSVSAVSDEGRTDTWSEIVDPLHFGFWSKSNIQLSWEDVGDATSPVSAIEYYLSSSVTALREEELRAVTNWTEFGVLNLSSNIQTTMYVKITDMAGNASYISTNALIVDDTAPYDEMLPPDISITAEQEKSGIYNGDVNVSVTVDEPLVGDAYSGLNTVAYRILNMGQETESGTLYTFNTVAPQYSDLLKTWEGEITISSEVNNSNDVILEIYAQDNALNTSVEQLPLSIDTTPPEISVSFNNYASQNGLFKDAITARVSIAERNFSKDLVTITATHNQVNYIPDVVWKQGDGTGNGDNTIWYADIPFSEDGEYTFDIACTDLAGNKSVPVQGTEVPAVFTIDKTKPQVNVVFDGIASKDNYYQSVRTAVITIEELNFDKDKVVINAKGSHNGEDVNPIIQWQEDDENHNIHTAVVTFSEDAKYSLTVNYTDEAGNIADVSYQDKKGNPVIDNKEFYIDTIDPKLNISIDGNKKFKPYNEIAEVLPVIIYTDDNFDENQVAITMSATKVEISPVEIKDDTISFMLTSESGKKLRWTGRLEDVIDEKNSQKVIGKQIIFDPLYTAMEDKAYKEFDDIYTISVSVADKSGRQANAGAEDQNCFSFSINCFGSTYDISAVPSSGAYLQNGKEIVVTEINPNELTKYWIELEKNTKTQILEEGKDYDIILTGKETEWHEYVYKIHADVFQDDGSYRIGLHSVDKAGNSSDSAEKIEDSNIEFFVDKEAPTAIVVNLESNKTYYVDDNMTVFMIIYDNYILEEVSVYLDDDENVYQHWDAEEAYELKKDKNSEFAFDIKAENFLANNAHKLTVICKDASGRENEPVIIDNFKIITGDSRKPWIYVGISAAVILTTGTTVAIIRKRKITENRT